MPGLRRRTQLVLPAHQGRSVSAIALIAFRSQDTMLRHRKRFVSGGLPAPARRSVPGAAPVVTPEWEARLLRVIDLDPHTLGVPSANWTTTPLADCLARMTGDVVTGHTVRLHLHANASVCKRPTWTLERTAKPPTRPATTVRAGGLRCDGAVGVRQIRCATRCAD